MMLEHSQIWTLEDGSHKTTHDVFVGLLNQQISPDQKCKSESHPEWQAISTRFTLIKHYGILDTLGQGAFGMVYLGFNIKRSSQQKMGRLVAIKKPSRPALQRMGQEMGAGAGLAAEYQARSLVGQTFSEEALLTGFLQMCKYVVAVIEHDIAEPYIVLEYCDGGSLSQRIKQEYNTQDAIKWGYEIALALQAAHNLEPDCLVHRDLKPQNILLHKGVVKVSDFGTSKMVHETQSLRSLHEGFTPKYAAPEAFDGKAYPATDVWSLGVILYELLCGEVPFEGQTSLNLFKKICF